MERKNRHFDKPSRLHAFFLLLTLLACCCCCWGFSFPTVVIRYPCWHFLLSPFAWRWEDTLLREKRSCLLDYVVSQYQVNATIGRRRSLTRSQSGMFSGTTRIRPKNPTRILPIPANCGNAILPPRRPFSTGLFPVNRQAKYPQRRVVSSGIFARLRKLSTHLLLS